MKMQSNVLERVRIIEDKYGIKYAKTNGALYKALRVIYTILFAYTMGINVLYLLGMLLVYGGTENFVGVKNTFITICICTGLIIAGYILSAIRFKLIGCIVSAVPMVFSVLAFARVMEDSLGLFGYKYSFYWRHLAPLVLMLLLIVWTTVIHLRAKLKTEKQYKKVMENLYTIYNSGAEDVSDEQWGEFLAKYDPRDYTKLFKATEAKEENAEAEEQ